MNTRRALMSLVLILTTLSTSLRADTPKGKSRSPVAKQEFELTYYDIREDILQSVSDRTLVVDFDITEEGKVENARVVEDVDLRINNTVIRKVMALKFKPALQNGRPVRVRYKLPIVFK